MSGNPCSRPGSRAATSRCCSARPPSSGAALARAPRRPGPGGARAVARGGARATTSCVELVSHRLPGPARPGGRAPRPHAARMAGFARSAGLGAVLTNAVRYADRRDAPTVDVLDAARRLVPSTGATSTAATPRGSSSPARRCTRSPRRSARLAGLGDSDREARRLLAHTRAVADRCALDPRADLGLGEVHFPEFELPGAEPGRRSRPTRCCARAARPRSAGRYGAAPRQRIWKRLDDELRDDPRARLRVVLPHRRRRHRPDPRDGRARARRAGRARAAWSTTCSASPGSTRSGTAC